MSLLWLRFALGCYFIGLIYAFFALSRTSDLFSRIALHAASLGMVFHFVSLVELFLSGQVVWASVHNGESLLAFFSMSFFMIIRVALKALNRNKMRTALVIKDNQLHLPAGQEHRRDWRITDAAPTSRSYLTFLNLCSERRLSGRGLSLKVCGQLVHDTSPT